MAALATARRRASSPARQQQSPEAQRRAMRPQLGMPAYMQRKMRLGEPGDAYEVEADHVADHVTRDSVSAGHADPGVQRAPAEEKKEAAKPGAAGGGKPDQKGGAAAGAKDQKPAAGGKDDKAKAAGGAKDQKGGAPGAKPAQTPEKKDQVARKEVSADDKVEKEKKEHGKKEEQKQKLAGDKDSDVQMKSARPMISRLADTSIRRDAKGGAGTVAPDAESRIDSSRGRGKALPEETRSAMESGFGEDFSSVRVHDDADADGLSRDLDAHAFTVGNDIYFAQGAYAPETGEGRHLLAHELTHVVQQGGSEGVQRMAAGVQCDKPKSKGSGKGKVEDGVYTGDEGEIAKDYKKKSRETIVPKVKLPKVKAPFGSAPFTLSPIRREDNPTEQSKHWKTATPAASVGKALDDLLEKKKVPKSFKSGRNLYFLKIGGKELVGTRGMIISQLRNPAWNRNGKDMSFQIDHQWEVQLGGPDDSTNVWLLEAATNQASGRKINGEISSSLRALISAAFAAKLWKTQPEYDDVRYGPTIKLTDPQFTGGPTAGQDKIYTADDINTGKQLAKVRPMTLKEIKDTGLGEDSDRELYTVFTRPGGTARVIALKPGGGSSSVKKDFLPGLEGAQISISDKGGSISGTVEIKKGKSAIKKPIDVTFALNPMKGEDAENSFVIDQGDLKKAFGSVTMEGWSPVDFTSVDFTPEGIVASAVVRIDVPIIKQGVTAALTIGPEGLEVSGTIEAGALELPGPVQVTGGSFTLKLGAKGLGASGEVNFEVKGLGSGTISAAMDAAGPQLDGKFEGASDTFSRFGIELHYNRSKGFWGGGDVEVAKGKIPGVKRATAKVTVEDKQWTAEGTVDPEVKILKSVKIGAAYTEGAGFTFTGKAEIGEAPCVSGGDVSVTLAQAGEGWDVSADGTLNLSAPGLDAATAKVSYAKGVFTAEVTVGFKKGRLSGTVTIGVTNQPKALPIPADAPAAVGAPAAPPKAAPDQLTFYGSGSVTIQITPWLKGTIAMAFLPNGDVIVTGKVVLGEIELVPEKTFNKEIFSMHVDIPIVGVSFAGQRVGIFATVGGNVSFKAGFGPVKLRNTELDVTYSPQHEDQTAVHGTAQVWCPASAGLRIAINGGVGVGIPIVSATVGLELGGEVGIKGEATLDIVVDWAANKPFTFTTTGALEVMPTIKIDLSAFAKVEADLLLKTITLYEERWQLAGYEWGSDAKFRVEFPITYTEGKGLDLSLDNIKVTAPEIDPIAMVGKMIG